MKKSKFTEEQIAYALRQVESGDVEVLAAQHLDIQARAGGAYERNRAVECEPLVARSTPQRGRDPLDIQHGAGQVGAFADERPAEGERVRDDLAQLADAQVDHFHPARTGVTSSHVGDGPAQGQLMHAVARCRSSSGVPGYPDPESMIAFASRPWTT